MTILDPTVRVMCDKCEEEEEFEMTVLARGNFDMRDLDKSLLRMGWRIVGDQHFCPDCESHAD